GGVGVVGLLEIRTPANTSEHRVIDFLYVLGSVICCCGWSRDADPR
ncbi:MAG: hypothetical protein ACI88C_001924, partial [Acidimicrobiales bacterium]